MQQESSEVPASVPARRRGRAANIAGLLLVILVGTAVVGLHIRDDVRLSPIDETQHVDYLAKAAEFHIPRVEETDGPVAREEVSCRGIETSAYEAPTCASWSSAPITAYPEDGVDTAAVDPPLYYTVTGLAARAVKAVLHLQSLVTAARLLGIAWLIAALVLLWLAMAEMGIPALARTAAGLLLVTTPVVIHSQATVTNDGILLFCGAAALSATLLWESRRLNGALLLVVAVICALAKVTALVAVGVTALYLLVRAARASAEALPGARRRVELVVMAVATVAAAIGVTLVWLAITHLRRVPGAPLAPSEAAFRATHLTLTDLALQWGAFLTPLNGPPILAPLRSVYVLSLLAVVNAIVLAGTLGAAALATARSRLEAVGAATAALMLVGGPALVLAIYAADHSILPNIPHRYGLALMPAAALCVGAAFAKVWLRRLMGLFAAGAAVFTLVHLATH